MKSLNASGSGPSACASSTPSSMRAIPTTVTHYVAPSGTFSSPLSMPRPRKKEVPEDGDDDPQPAEPRRPLQPRSDFSQG
jgi:hypothetical protein